MESERSALSVFCAALPDLRVRAARGFWQDTLDMHVSEVAEGGSCRELGLLARPGGDSPERGDLEGASAGWLPAPVLVGDYHCPVDRCVRRAARDDEGRPPRCALYDQPMSFARRPS
jgi:hypothetical protein